MKNILFTSLTITFTIFLLATPSITVANTSSIDLKDQMILTLLDRIKALETELKQVKAEKSKPTKVEVTTQNSDYKKEVSPLIDQLEEKQELREKQILRVAESLCKNPKRYKSKDKATFVCHDDTFILDTNIDVKTIKKMTSTKQRKYIDNVKATDKEIAELVKRIDSLKSRYGIK